MRVPPPSGMNPFRDLQNPRWMYLKAILFLLMLLLSAAALLVETRTAWRIGFILLLIWSSACSYYFAFYVIERYVDPAYRFAGLCSLIGYLFRRRK